MSFDKGLSVCEVEEYKMVERQPEFWGRQSVTSKHAPRKKKLGERAGRLNVPTSDGDASKMDPKF